MVENSKEFPTKCLRIASIRIISLEINQSECLSMNLYLIFTRHLIANQGDDTSINLSRAYPISFPCFPLKFLKRNRSEDNKTRSDKVNLISLFVNQIMTDRIKIKFNHKWNLFGNAKRMTNQGIKFNKF